MFRSLMTIIRELYLYLTKVIFMLKHSLLSNFSSMVEHEFLIKGIQQLGDIFSIARRNFRARLIYWVWEQTT